MTRHKWAKEIKAWADGAEIEARNREGYNNTIAEFAHWWTIKDPRWETHDDIEYRIKPQPKEQEYLYAYERIDNGNIQFSPRLQQTGSAFEYIGKIKLEGETSSQDD